ncbi:condensation domain-containing protein (plasmid) [Streptomyces sp. NBC_00536]|uniref:condensation domain-containing protein n=1 Tax=Streptomyces sp. NBC_00536 TaxID=2975769 RepID=UPI002E7FBB91|nr:condensation domain-containing protein [Streptomyces sp. NBC_00536]WUC84222.1 condensation domain-containing protein [Streptomyces sp. NBC_00536]
MQTPTPLEELLDLAADVLRHDRRTLPAGASGSPFLTLGGGLGQAMRLQARADEQLGLSLDVAQLLGAAPLTDVLARAVPVAPAAPDPGPGPRELPLLPGQSEPLTAQRYVGPGAVHRMLSAELAGPLDPAVLRAALAALGARHEGLRTAFPTSARGPVRRVLDAYAPPLITLPELPGAPAASAGAAVDAVHARLAEEVDRLIGHPDRPPYVFALTRLAADRHLLSFLCHHAVADAWSAALVWRELLADYARAAAGRQPAAARAGAPPPLAIREDPDPVLLSERVERIREFPAVVDLTAPGRRPAVFDFRGERLSLALDAELRDAVDSTAARAGVPHGTVLLAAWALAVGRRSGHEWLLVGAELPRHRAGAPLRTVAPGSASVPVCCELEGGVDYFLRGIACAFGEALACAALDTDALVRELGLRGDRSRTPLTQVTFADHDGLLPVRTTAGPLTARFHHGHLGGATADATLTVLRWREDPLLALDFASAVLDRAQASALANDLRTALTALSSAAETDPVEDLLPAGLTKPSLAPLPVAVSG